MNHRIAALLLAFAAFTPPVAAWAGKPAAAQAQSPAKLASFQWLIQWGTTGRFARLDLYPDGTFTSASKLPNGTFTPPSPPVGHWTLEGDHIRFLFATGDIYEGEVHGKAMDGTYYVEGNTMVLLWSAVAVAGGEKPPPGFAGPPAYVPPFPALPRPSDVHYVPTQVALADQFFTDQFHPIRAGGTVLDFLRITQERLNQEAGLPAETSFEAYFADFEKTVPPDQATALHGGLMPRLVPAAGASEGVRARIAAYNRALVAFEAAYVQLTGAQIEIGRSSRAVAAFAERAPAEAGHAHLSGAEADAFVAALTANAATVALAQDESYTLRFGLRAITGVIEARYAPSGVVPPAKAAPDGSWKLVMGGLLSYDAVFAADGTWLIQKTPELTNTWTADGAKVQLVAMGIVFNGFAIDGDTLAGTVGNGTTWYATRAPTP